MNGLSISSHADVSASGITRLPGNIAKAGEVLLLACQESCPIKVAWVIDGALHNGLDALRKLPQAMPDVVILEHCLPELNGIACAI